MAIRRLAIRRYTARQGSDARSRRAGDAVTVIDAASGNTRAKIVKTAAGNAEKLAP